MLRSLAVVDSNHFARLICTGSVLHDRCLLWCIHILPRCVHLHRVVSHDARGEVQEACDMDDLCFLLVLVHVPGPVPVWPRRLQGSHLVRHNDWYEHPRCAFVEQLREHRPCESSTDRETGPVLLSFKTVFGCGCNSRLNCFCAPDCSSHCRGSSVQEHLGSCWP